MEYTLRFELAPEARGAIKAASKREVTAIKELEGMVLQLSYGVRSAFSLERWCGQDLEFTGNASLIKTKIDDNRGDNKPVK